MALGAEGRWLCGEGADRSFRAYLGQAGQAGTMPTSVNPPGFETGPEYAAAKTTRLHPPLARAKVDGSVRSKRMSSRLRIWALVRAPSSSNRSMYSCVTDHIKLSTLTCCCCTRKNGRQRRAEKEAWKQSAQAGMG